MAEAANPSVTKSYRVFFKQSDGMDFDARLVQVHCGGICDDFHYTLRALPTYEWDLVLNEDASRRMNKTADGQQASR